MLFLLLLLLLCGVTKAGLHDPIDDNWVDLFER